MTCRPNLRTSPRRPRLPPEVVLCTTADGRVTVDVFFARDNFWLTQRTMAELFGVKAPAVNKHLKNIFESGEMAEDSVVSILETTAADPVLAVSANDNAQIGDVESDPRCGRGRSLDVTIL